MVKVRSPIPDAIAARILFDSDHTCCVCRERGRPLQIHHIDEIPSHHDAENLALLCLICHEETQIRGGFGRKLRAAEIVEFRTDWLRRVAVRRDRADDLAAARQAGSAAPAASTRGEAAALKIPAKDALVGYVNAAPLVVKAAYESARLRWASGVTTDMMRGTYEVIDVVEGLWLHLATWYPSRHFGGMEPKEYFSQFLSSRFDWHRALAEPDGPGTGGAMIGPITAARVLKDAESSVVELVRALVADHGGFSFHGWYSSWNAARGSLDGPDATGPKPPLGAAPTSVVETSDRRSPEFESRFPFEMLVDGNCERHWVEVVRHYAGSESTGRVFLRHVRPGGLSAWFDEVEGHSFTGEAANFDGDAIPELAVLWHTGAHTHCLKAFSFADGVFREIPGSMIGSDWPIRLEDRDGDGVLEIYTLYKVSADDDSLEIAEESFRFLGGRIERMPEAG